MNVRYRFNFVSTLVVLLVLSCQVHADGRDPSNGSFSSSGSRDSFETRTNPTNTNSVVRKSRPPIKIGRPESREQDANREGGSSSSGQLGTTLAALAFVVLLIVGAAKLLKKHSPGFTGALPNEALDILGRRYIDQRHSILLIRCGSKLLVVGITPDGMNTLSEIDDLAEVDLLAGLSRTKESDSSFRQLFMQNRSQQLAQGQPTAASPLPRSAMRQPVPTQSASEVAQASPPVSGASIGSSPK